MDRRQFDALQRLRGSYDIENIWAYADAIERGPDSPVALKWDGTDAMAIHARLGEGQSLIVQESFDFAWRAVENGQDLPIRQDIVGFMCIDAPPGEHRIRVYFQTPLAHRLGRVLALLSATVLIALIARRPARHEVRS